MLIALLGVLTNTDMRANKVCIKNDSDEQLSIWIAPIYNSVERNYPLHVGYVMHYCIEPHTIKTLPNEMLITSKDGETSYFYDLAFFYNIEVGIYKGKENIDIWNKLKNETKSACKQIITNDVARTLLTISALSKAQANQVLLNDKNFNAPQNYDLKKDPVTVTYFGDGTYDIDFPENSPYRLITDPEEFVIID